MNTKVAQFAYTHYKKIFFWMTLAVFLSSVLLYVYYLNATILHIVERKSAEQSISKITMHISELEYTYMEISTTITQDHAYTLGFKAPEDTVFARRDVHTSLAQLSQ